MSVRLTEYKPLLDVLIPLVQDLVKDSETELYVPKHPEAIGLAIDSLYYLENLYPFLQIEVVAKRTMDMTKRRDERARKFKVRAIFEEGEFSVPDPEFFSLYPFISIIDKDMQDKTPSKVSISSSNTAKKHAHTKTKHMSTVVGQSGVVVPPSRNMITTGLNYQTISPFAISSTYQTFYPSRVFYKKTGEEGINYPISSESRHLLDRKSWSFFMLPVFWHSWSQYSSIALNKLSGRFSYEETARRQNVDFARIKYHAGRAEVSVIEMLARLVSGKPIDDVAERFGCPYEYRSIYTDNVFRSMEYLCNKQTLGNRTGFWYLVTLSEACHRRGYDITPQQFADIKF